MDAFVQDLRIGVRRLLGSPGFTASALLVLALGVGANTANFSIVNAVLLRPLPYADPDRLVQVYRTEPRRELDGLRVSLPLYLDLVAGADVFADLGAYTYSSSNLGGGEGEPENLTVGRLTTNLLPLLGVRPALGRAFSEQEGRPGGDRVALLSDGLWRRRFAANREVLGRTIELDGEGYTVIGVMAPDFNFPFGEVQLWTPAPLALGARAATDDYLQPVGRLKPGIGVGEARAELAELFKQLRPRYPSLPADGSLRAVPLREALVFFFDTVRVMMLLSVVAHLFVLLIVCANVAGLMLGQAAGRQRDIAMRSALGATRNRLVRQLLVEGLLLALTAAVLGTMLAYWVAGLAGGLLPAALYRVGVIAVDGQALLFTLAVAVVTTLMFALVPALQATKVDLVESLKEGGSGTAGGRRTGRLRNLMVITQVAAAVVLVVGTALVVQSFEHLRHIDTGFDAGPVLTLEVRIAKAEYPSDRAVAAFFERLVDETAGLPGVAAAAVVAPLPLNFEANERRFLIAGREPSSADERLHAREHLVSPGYFSAMGIAVLAGRGFAARGPIDGPAEVVVNRAFAETYWPGRPAVGEQLELQDLSGDGTARATVVGVVADTKNFLVNEAPQAIVYLPQSLEPQRRNFLVVRTGGPPLAAAASVRAAVQTVGRGVPVSKVRTMEQVVAGSLQPWEIAAKVLAGLAALALVLAGVGIYGVVTYSVRKRVREIGVRIALGATSRQVAALTLGEGARLAAVGLVLGLLAAIGLARLLASVLFGVGALDVVALAGSVLAIGATVFVATLVPTRRALRLDPTVALRGE